MTMPTHRIFAMPFARVYPMYVQKAERKNRTKDEVDRIICCDSSLVGRQHTRGRERGVGLSARRSPPRRAAHARRGE
jgi:hypothetical protein